MTTFEPLGSANFIADYAAKLPLRVILRYLGIPEADADQIHAWSGCLLAVRWAGNLTGDEWIKTARGYVEYQQYVAALVAARRVSPRDDLLSDLVRLSDDADVRMDRAEMFGQIAALISAGHETSISLIAFCVFYLLADRRQWEALCADPGLAAAAVKEGMRYESPAVSTWRVAREDTDLSGVTVPAGGKVLVLIASANRNRDICEHADTFDLAHKTDVPNLGSAGGRICASEQPWPASTWRSRCRYWQNGCRASALGQVPRLRSGPASRSHACERLPRRVEGRKRRSEPEGRWPQDPVDPEVLEGQRPVGDAEPAGQLQGLVGLVQAVAQLSCGAHR